MSNTRRSPAPSEPKNLRRRVLGAIGIFGIAILVGVVGVAFVPKGFYSLLIGRYENLKGASKSPSDDGAEDRKAAPETRAPLTAEAPPSVLGSLKAILKNDGNAVAACGPAPTLVPDSGGSALEPFAPVNSAMLMGIGDKLAASDLEQERALGLQTRAISQQVLEREELFVQDPGCAKDKDCLARAPQLSRDPSSDIADPLAVLAATTTDADIYAAAFYQCQRKTTAACAPITIGRWTELDPDNAVPWMIAALIAVENNDDAKQDAAFKRAAEATKYNQRIPSFAPVLSNKAVQSLASHTPTATSVAFLGAYYNADLTMPYSRLPPYCMANTSDG